MAAAEPGSAAPARRPGVPARRSGDRRAELVAVASRLFREHGYHGVGMRAIAEAAGIQAASLYHHFMNKEELLLEAIFVVDRDLIVEQLPLLDGPGDHRERLAALVRGHVLHIGDHRNAWWVASRELRALSPDRLDAVQVYRRRYQHRIAEFLVDGVRAGEFRCEDPRLATLAILDMINGVNEWYVPSGRLGITELAERYARMVLCQLGAGKL
ncbi:MAG TPA: TetR/AcrR family transcriptional regulator [Pseudonocardia sp.]|jgi:AcrR family transcriptional regulator